MVETEKQNIMPKIRSAKLAGNNNREPFTTIDDLIYLARELQLGLSKLGEYKYPLGVRKGVRKLNKERESMTIKSIGRMYFLDLKETKDGNPFLVITESRSKKEGEGRERSSILVFQENAQEFAEAVTSMVAKISS
jgi:hypothetical protein